MGTTYDFIYTEGLNGIEITGYNGSSAEITIPPSINGEKVNSISPDFDVSCNYNKTNITKITISSHIVIMRNAFKDLSKLTEVHFKNVDGLIFIYNDAFPSSLEKITFPAGTTCKTLRENFSDGSDPYTFPSGV